jgi:hypothetical protein
MLDNVAVRNRVYGLIELDVTKDREYMRSYKEKTGETLSFTGWIVKCKGQAVSKDKQVQAYRRGKNSARAEPLLLLLPLFSLNVTYRFIVFSQARAASCECYRLAGG